MDYTNKNAIEFECVENDADSIHNPIHKLTDNVQKAFQFRERVLGELFGGNATDNEAIAEIKRLQAVEAESRQTPKAENTIDAQRQLSGIASVLNIPLDSKQPDIFFAIMKLKEDLRLFKKVIARLIGE